MNTLMGLMATINMKLIGLFADDTFSIGKFLESSTETLKKWGGYLIVLIGVVMIVASVVQIAKGLMSKGGQPTNWAVVVLLLLLGGAFFAGGFEFVSRIAKGGQKTIEDLGSGGTILPTLRMLGMGIGL